MKSVYKWLRHKLSGRGLSRIPILVFINEKMILPLIKGKRKEYVVKSGKKIYMDPAQSLAEAVEEYEPKTTDLVLDLLKSGGVFVDVGASIGWFTLFASDRATSVYAFEPHHESCELLRKNVTENHCKNVVVEEAAVSDRVGTSVFYSGKSWTWSSLIDNGGDRREVATLTLDSYFADKRVDVLKIDVEGAEGLVMRGGANTIKKWRPHIICEISHENLKWLGDLTDSGYSIYTVDEHKKTLVPKTPKEIENISSVERVNSTNMYLKPTEKGSQTRGY